MRHRNKTRKISLKTGPRRAVTKNLAASLILYEKVKTTQARAKLVVPLVERLITKGKQQNLNSRRYLIERLPGRNSVNKVLEVLAPRYISRAGGYTRTTKLNRRRGDGAQLALIEFV
jgi:large subunit ribosomal protein L17